MHISPLILLAAIGLTGILLQWLAWQVGVPAIVFLLLAGIAAGPVAGLLDPDALFGDLLFPVVSLGVAVILFEGSLNLRLREIRGLKRSIRNLITIGASINAAVIAAATHWLLALPWGLSLLFGALMSVTGPTVIKPLLRSARPSPDVARVLEWEGIVLDPIGAFVAVLMLEFLVTTQPGLPLLTLAWMIGVGAGIGVGGAWALATLLRHHWLPHFLQHVFTLAFVLAVFAASDALAHESGLLAVTLMGVMLANMKGLNVEDLVFFKESLSLMLVSVLFIVLAARLEPSTLFALGWPAAALFVVLVLVARPLSVMISTIGSRLDWRKRALLSWIAPRGIVAAAVASLFALRLEQAGYPGAQALVPLTFMVIIGTVTLQSLTAAPLARALKVAEPEPRGVLMAGANPFARALAASLREQDVPVRIADTGWENVNAARMAGLDTWFGRVVSERADEELDLSGIGRLLAMSPDRSLNALACFHFKHDFGPENLYRIRPVDASGERRQREGSVSVPGRYLFGAASTYDRLESLLAEGFSVRSTRLGEGFGLAEYHKLYGDRAVPLYLLDPRGRLYFFTDGRIPEPGPAWRITSLLPADAPEIARPAV
jgi:CPA1 family monovalent cation:H+ antiporter